MISFVNRKAVDTVPSCEAGKITRLARELAWMLMLFTVADFRCCFKPLQVSSVPKLWWLIVGWLLVDCWLIVLDCYRLLWPVRHLLVTSNTLKKKNMGEFSAFSLGNPMNRSARSMMRSPSTLSLHWHSKSGHCRSWPILVCLDRRKKKGGCCCSLKLGRMKRSK